MNRVLAALALAAVTSALAAGCGGGGGSGDAEAKAEIQHDWETFFDGSTPAATRVALLENGPQFARIIGTISASPLSKQLSVKVGDIDVDDDSADVKYTLLLGRNEVLRNVEGKAVRVNGRWKVGVASFCQLLALQGARPKECPAPPK